MQKFLLAIFILLFSNSYAEDSWEKYKKFCTTNLVTDENIMATFEDAKLVCDCITKKLRKQYSYIEFSNLEEYERGYEVMNTGCTNKLNENSKWTQYRSNCEENFVLQGIYDSAKSKQVCKCIENYVRKKYSFDDFVSLSLEERSRILGNSPCFI